MNTSQRSALFTDFYELTMMAGYQLAEMAQQKAVFDFFFRRPPAGVDFIITAGQPFVLQYLQDLKFTKEELHYLSTKTPLPKDFVASLEDFSFTGDMWAMKEGTIAFSNEPVIRIEANLLQAQLVETAIINKMCYSSLVASNASQVRRAAGHQASLLEFGARRAHGHNGAFSASRAAFLGGCDATSNVESAYAFDIPVAGTQAHAWVMAFDNEIESFRAFANAFPEDCVLLVDTYDTLESGVPNAIKVGLELREQGKHLKGIRLDSGDLAKLAKGARKLLDDAGLHDTIIVASGDLDAKKITALREEGAPIDSYGVGTSLVTAKQDPTISGVYKLAQIEDSAVAKISNTPGKTTNPGKKQVWRTLDGDIIALDGEECDGEPLLEKQMENGKIIEPLSTVHEGKERANEQIVWLGAHSLDKVGINWSVQLSDGAKKLRDNVLEDMADGVRGA